MLTMRTNMYHSEFTEYTHALRLSPSQTPTQPLVLSLSHTTPTQALVLSHTHWIADRRTHTLSLPLPPSLRGSQKACPSPVKPKFSMPRFSSLVPQQPQLDKYPPSPSCRPSESLSPFFLLCSSVSSHRVGVWMIFSTSSSKAHWTPSRVLADASMNIICRGE